MDLIIGYLDNELLAKDNPSADKPVKKARGGVASRKAKTNSLVASAARSKVKPDNKHTPSVVEEESPHASTTIPSKAGDLSFVLNAPAQSPQSTPTKSPNVQPVKHPQTHPESSPTPAELVPGIPEPPPTFTPAEPAHNRTLPDVLI